MKKSEQELIELVNDVVTDNKNFLEEFKKNLENEKKDSVKFKNDFSEFVKILKEKEKQTETLSDFNENSIIELIEVVEVNNNFLEYQTNMLYIFNIGFFVCFFTIIMYRFIKNFI